MPTTIRKNKYVRPLGQTASIHALKLYQSSWFKRLASVCEVFDTSCIKAIGSKDQLYMCRPNQISSSSMCFLFFRQILMKRLEKEWSTEESKSRYISSAHHPSVRMQTDEATS